MTNAQIGLSLAYALVMAILASILITTVINASSGAATSPKDLPVLVGYGCNGASGPLYAKHEDEFPAPCTRIEEIDSGL